MHTAYSDHAPWRARLAFARSPQALIDLAAILPAYASLAGVPDLRVLLILRLTRFFKLARYSPGLRSLAAALHAERRALFACAVTLMGLVLITASAMHVAEAEAQPDRFGSIPSAMWWAIVTLTTVGYGDVVPITVVGRMMMLALPIGIVATAFSEEIHRREFVVTWGMIARVPLFARLDASEIADIMRYLRAQTVPAGAVIVRRGEQADSMYFVAEGGVEVELEAGRRIRLANGSFFGEIALMRPARRMATVRATQQTKLLALDAMDLQAVIERNPELNARLEAALREHGPPTPGRDILPDEMRPPRGG
jgi:voltage-gated potassium channel